MTTPFPNSRRRSTRLTSGPVVVSNPLAVPSAVPPSLSCLGETPAVEIVGVLETAKARVIKAAIKAEVKQELIEAVTAAVRAALRSRTVCLVTRTKPARQPARARGRSQDAGPCVAAAC